MRLTVGLLIHGLWVLLEEKNSELFDEVQKQEFFAINIYKRFYRIFGGNDENFKNFSPRQLRT